MLPALSLCHPSEKYPDLENEWSCLELATHNMALYSMGKYVSILSLTFHMTVFIAAAAATITSLEQG